MAKKNYVNLLKEIRGIRNCDLIIFTTYSFDPFFFDHMILKELKESNPDSDIIVLVDAEHTNIEESTKVTGVEYVLLPLPPTFHPKLFIFCSDQNITAFIGSHNLTLTGFTHNLELSCKITDPEISGKCLEYVGSVLFQFLDPNHRLLKRIAGFVGKQGARTSGQIKVQFLHNLDKPILSQALGILNAEQVNLEEISVIAPFFSSVRQLLQEIHKETGVTRVNICIQLNNHNLEVDAVEDLPYVTLLKIESKDQRRIHCKIILFQSKQKQFLLMGSPNFTKAAMMEIAKHKKGNYEAALLIQLTTSPHVLSELKFHEVSKDEIKQTTRVETQEEEMKKIHVHLILAEYDFLELRIDAITLKPILNVKLNIESPDREVDVHERSLNIDPHERRIILSLVKGIQSGSSIWLSLNGRQISNKIPISMPHQGKLIDFDQKNFGKISAMIGGSKNLGELLQIMLRVFPLEGDTVTHFPSSSVHRAGKRIVSYRRRSPPRKNILDLLEKLFRVRREKLDGVLTHVDRTPHARSSPYLSEISFRKRIDKILDRFAEIFEKAKLSFDNSPSIYCLFILFSMKICEGICSLFNLYEIFDSLLSRSMENFETMLEDHGVSDAAIGLLSLLLYLEEEMGCKTSRHVLEKVVECCSISPTSLVDLVETMESMKEEVSKALGSMSLHVPNEKRSVYSMRVAELVWGRAHNILWRSLADREKLVKDLAVECLSLVRGYDSVPFNTLFDAARGEEMALGELEVYYDRWPVVSKEGFPLFEVEHEDWVRIVDLTCQKLLNNLHMKLQETKTGKPCFYDTSKRKLEHLIRKDIEAILFSKTENTQTYLINLGRLFESIDPKRSRAIKSSLWDARV